MSKPSPFYLYHCSISWEYSYQNILKTMPQKIEKDPKGWLSNIVIGTFTSSFSCFVFPDFHRPRLQQRPTPVHIMPAISAHSGEGPGGHTLHPPLCSKGCAIRTCLPNEKYPQCLSMIYTSSTYIYILYTFIYLSIHLIYYINSYYIITTIILLQRSSPVYYMFPHLQDLYLRRLRLQEGPALRRAAAAAGRRRVRPPRLG